MFAIGKNISLKQSYSFKQRREEKCFLTLLCAWKMSLIAHLSGVLAFNMNTACLLTSVVTAAALTPPSHFSTMLFKFWKRLSKQGGKFCPGINVKVSSILVSVLFTPGASFSRNPSSQNSRSGALICDRDDLWLPSRAVSTIWECCFCSFFLLLALTDN